MDDDEGRFGRPVDAVPLLEPERAALLDLLAALEPADWARPTPCPGWSVHDLALHLVHADLRRLAAQRDGHPPPALGAAATLDELAALLAAANEQWVTAAAATISPRLTCEMLAWLAEPLARHLAGLPPAAQGWTVSWAGPGPHPNWLDVAREYTERWVHQQQLRDAVGRPGLTEARFVMATLDTFSKGLPAQLPAAAPGTIVQIRIDGPVRATWTLAREGDRWRFRAPAAAPDAEWRTDAEVMWRRAVRALDRDEARARSTLTGPHELAGALLDLRGVIVGDASRPWTGSAAPGQG